VIKPKQLIGNAKESTRAWTALFVGKPKTQRALLAWRAPDFYLVDKGIGWGVVMIVVFLALAALLTYFGQVLTAVVAILFMIVVLKFAYAKPETIEYRIEEDGIRISGWLHPYYADLIAYWVARQEGKPTLYLQTRNLLTDHLAVPIGHEISVKKLTRVLDKYLPEHLPPRTPRVAKRKRALF